VLLAVGLLAAMRAGAADLEIGRRFQDWVGGCERDPERQVKGCFIFQKLFLPETGRQVATVAVGYTGASGPPMAVFKIPLGTLLPPGITVRIDAGEQRSFPLQFCDREGCRAHVPLEPDLLSAMKAGLVAELSFQDLERKTITTAVSLRGFTRGLASLKRGGR